MSHEGIRFVNKEEAEQASKPDQPLSRASVTPAKVKVLLTEGKGLEIEWEDGHKSAWTFAWLRDACPCATCIDERKNEGREIGQPRRKTAELLPMFKPPAKPASAHAVGRYAIQFNWLDSHSAGIYSWDFLRRNCQCGECRLAETETPGTPN